MQLKLNMSLDTCLKCETNNKVKLLQNKVEIQQEIIQDVIADFPLYSKRQAISRIIRMDNKNFSSRYAKLYQTFQMKYHIDIKRRLANKTIKKLKIKTYIDYIEYIGKMDELYDLAVALFMTN